MTDSLKFFKIDETSVYNDGYIYSFYRNLVPSKLSADSPQWLSFQCLLKNQKDCHVRVNTTANWEIDKQGRKFHWEIIKTGKHNHEPEQRDTTRRLKFYKNDESSVIRNGYTYTFYRDLDSPKPCVDFQWRMSYHCPVSANNQDSCRARIHTTGEWIVDERGKEYQWGMFKNCEHSHELGQISIITQGIKAKGNLKCSLCPYSSKRSGDITVHMRTHTGEKPYKCHICSYAGTTTSKLISHMRTHTGEKPYKCTMCFYASTHQSALKMHLRTHTGEKPYKCTLCSYASATKFVLTTHVRTHTGEKPFKCSLCSYASAQRNNLIRHMRSDHSLDKK